MERAVCRVLYGEGCMERAVCRVLYVECCMVGVQGR